MFSRDGSLIVTASDDGTARTWDAATGAPISVLRGHLKPVSDAEIQSRRNARRDRIGRRHGPPSGTPQRGIRSQVSAAMETSFRPPPSVPTARASSRHPRTTAPGSGTPQLRRRSRSCDAITATP